MQCTNDYTTQVPMPVESGRSSFFLLKHRHQQFILPNIPSLKQEQVSFFLSPSLKHKLFSWSLYRFLYSKMPTTTQTATPAATNSKTIMTAAATESPFPPPPTVSPIMVDSCNSTSFPVFPLLAVGVVASAVGVAEVLVIGVAAVRRKDSNYCGYVDFQCSSSEFMAP